MSRRMAVHVTKLCFLILAATVTYNEYLCYWLHYTTWPRTPRPKDGESTTLLLVADPQILGEDHEPGGLLGGLRRWDGDRYLAKAYRWALSAYSPSTVIFLGDLTDEASEADMDQMARYSARFHSIYPKEEGRRMVYLPGDNDIGGEGGDPVTRVKIDQFDTHFGGSSPTHPATEWLDIVPVSRLTQHGSYNLSMKPSHLSPSKLVIAVSHLPVLPLNGRFAQQVLELVNPDLVFSAHDHHGYLYTGERASGRMAREVDKFDRRDLNAPFTLQTRSRDGEAARSSLVWEVVVPTCSYRMGVQDMGLGLAVVSREGEVFYSNLWLPARFTLLYTYLASLVVVAALLGGRRVAGLVRACGARRQQTWRK